MARSHSEKVAEWNTLIDQRESLLAEQNRVDAELNAAVKQRKELEARIANLVRQFNAEKVARDREGAGRRVEQYRIDDDIRAAVKQGDALAQRIAQLAANFNAVKNRRDALGGRLIQIAMEAAGQGTPIRGFRIISVYPHFVYEKEIIAPGKEQAYVAPTGATFGMAATIARVKPSITVPKMSSFTGKV